MNRQNIFIIVFVLALAGIGYNFYRSAKLSPQITGEEERRSDLIKDLSKIRLLKDSKLDISIFQDAIFKNLESAPESIGKQTETTPGAGQTPGRPNPFLPINGILPTASIPSTR